MSEQETQALVERLLDALREDLTERGVQQWLQARLAEHERWREQSDTYR